MILVKKESNLNSTYGEKGSAQIIALSTIEYEPSPKEEWWCSNLEEGYHNDCLRFYIRNTKDNNIGNCVQAAFELFCDLLLFYDVTFCIGDSNLIGKHCWVEIDGVAIDGSNGGFVVMPLDKYYELMDICKIHKKRIPDVLKSLRRGKEHTFGRFIPKSSRIVRDLRHNLSLPINRSTSITMTAKRRRLCHMEDI